MYEDRFGGEFLGKNSFCDGGTIHFDCTYNSRCCSFLFCAEVGISCTKLFLKQLPHFLSGYNWPLVTCHRQASSPCCSAFLGKSSVYSQGVRGDIWWYFAKNNLILISTSYRVIVYYHKMLKDSNEKKIKLLKEQISLVSEV